VRVDPSRIAFVLAIAPSPGRPPWAFSDAGSRP